MLGHGILAITSTLALLLTAVSSMPDPDEKSFQAYHHRGEKCLSDQDAVEITQTYGNLFSHDFDQKGVNRLIADEFHFISDSYAAGFIKDNNIPVRVLFLHCPFLDL